MPRGFKVKLAQRESKVKQGVRVKWELQDTLVSRDVKVNVV